MLELEPCSACQAPSGWTCARCGPRCAAHVRRALGKGVRFKCDGCGGEASLLRVPRSSLVDFRTLVKPALQHPQAGRQVFALVLSVLAFWSVVVLGAVGFVLAGALSLVLAMQFLRARATGAEFDWPGPATFVEEVGAPLGRVLTAFSPLLVAAPVLFDLTVRRPWLAEPTHRWSLEAALLLDPVMMLLVTALVLLFPFAGVAALAAPSPIAALDVREWVRVGKAHFARLRWVWAFLGGGTLAALALRTVFPGGVGALLAAVAFCWGLYSAFGLLGDFLWVYASDVGYGRADESVVDAGDPAAPPAEEPAPVAKGPAPHLNTTLEGRLTSALDAKDARLAVSVYVAEADLADATLAPALLLRTGQAAASVDDLAFAIRALTAAGQHAGPDGAKALVIAARIFDERLRETDRARLLYESVLQRFPGTQAAQYAAQQLSDQRFFRRSTQ